MQIPNMEQAARATLTIINLNMKQVVNPTFSLGSEFT